MHAKCKAEIHAHSSIIIFLCSRSYQGHFVQCIARHFRQEQREGNRVFSIECSLAFFISWIHSFYVFFSFHNQYSIPKIKLLRNLDCSRNELKPGVLQSSLQQTYAMQECLRRKPYITEQGERRVWGNALFLHCRNCDSLAVAVDVSFLILTLIWLAAISPP